MTKKTLIALFFIPVLTFAALPPEAQKLLDSLPEKKITLPLVIQQAIQHSDSYRELSAMAYQINIPYLQSRIPLDYQLSFEASIGDDRSEPMLPYMPSYTKGTSYKVGASTYFSSGTQLSAEISHGNTEIGLAQGPDSYYETKGTITLSQNLWKDAFGKATRLGKEAGELSRNSNKAAFMEAQENWLLGLVNLFYSSWLAQAQSKTAADNVARRKRLLKVTRTKLRRGTAERPDLLQVESAHLSAKVSQAKTDQALTDRWRELVIALKFPKEWLNINPKEIPIKLDAPFKEIEKTCGSKNKIAPAPKENSSTRKAKLLAQASELKLKQAENKLSPNLALNVVLSANGINDSRGNTFTETLRFDNPGWRVGLSLSLPLSNYAEEIAARQALAERTKNEAQASYVQSQLKQNWLQACSDFYHIQNSYNLLKTAFENQLKRAKLEERRFGIGTVPTINVIQAGDDATRAEIELQVSEAQRRIAAWKVSRVAGQFANTIKKLTK